MKTLDLSKSVYELTQEYPEVVDIMAALGFTDITKKAMLLSVGRMMTIPKGAKMKGIPMEKIVAAFHEKGFEISSESGLNHNQNEKNGEEEEASRTEQLKAYLRRLGEGEDLESVRKDFVDQFGEVDAHEIMDAEQQLMAEGTPLEEVQRLCDVHSALFHGATSCETHAAPEGGNMFTAMMLAGIEGHPLHTFTKENEAIQRELDSWKKDHSRETFVRLRDVSIHYAKKGDLIYPLLKTKYDITGPQNVMWTVDDEIRDEMGALVREWDNARAEAVLARAEEMIYKEANILFPICAEHFTDEEWQGIYRDSKDYAPCLGVENKMWNDAEKSQQLTVNSQQLDEVRMPGGHLTLPQLTALLNTIPMEISFVDADNINRFFNEGPKVFKRPGMAIDREVFSCHPPKVEPMVRSIIDSFRSGKADRVPVWMDKGGRTMLVTYLAVRDADRTYLGTVELVQDMEFAKEHFAKSQL
ncbi:MAG: DUF438 domain-containing protein [Bacteroidales bacterium]|nr:DUF438 domain-containing protein [Bacteroidales bacterium]